ncbi:MAG: hypothetical protein ACI9PN_002725, partial [Candidatus Azotimanducaceae bacterium]
DMVEFGCGFFHVAGVPSVVKYALVTRSVGEWPKSVSVHYRVRSS